MSWPWHGQGLPPQMPLPGQGLPLPFGAPVPSLPPPPLFASFPPGHTPPPPPFFHPIAPNLPHPAGAWLPASHGMPWQQHQSHFRRHPTTMNMPPPRMTRMRQSANFRGQSAARFERPVMQSEPRIGKTNAQKPKKGAVSARDLAVSKEVFGKLGASLPGESKAEVDRWVAARKRNWPSRANVARKLAEKKKREESGAVMGGRVKKRPRAEENALTTLAAEYGSSDGEIDETETKSDVKKAHVPEIVKRGNAFGKREPGIGKKRQRGRRNGRRGNKMEVTVPRRPNLLRMLLEKEIQDERNMLLQAFRYILNRKRDSL